MRHTLRFRVDKIDFTYFLSTRTGIQLHCKSLEFSDIEDAAMRMHIGNDIGFVVNNVVDITEDKGQLVVRMNIQ